LRPVNQWNEGKQQEYCDRKTYKVEIPQAAPAQEGSHVQAILVKEP